MMGFKPAGIVSIFKQFRQFASTLEITYEAFPALSTAEPSDLWLEDGFFDDT